MRSVAVEWGYGEGLAAWHADAIIDSPLQLLSDRNGL